MSNILITGGCGYIGSQLSIFLSRLNHNVLIFDKECLIKSYFSNENIKVALCDLSRGDFYSILNRIPSSFSNIDYVIHLAGLKGVNSSGNNPLQHYEINLNSTFNVLRLVRELSIKNLIFISSATVYNKENIKETGFTEDQRLAITHSSPYGSSKLMIERILCDCFNSLKLENLTILRCFNPIGFMYNFDLRLYLKSKSEGGIIKSILMNLLYDKLLLVYQGYDTIDGSPIRDYFDVEDLFNLFEKIINSNKKGFNIYNVGSGNQTSTVQLISIFEKIFGKSIFYDEVGRCDAIIDSCFCNNSKVKSSFGWEPSISLETSIQHIKENVLNCGYSL